MNRTDIESFIELKFFPIKDTIEYVSSIPYSVREKVHQRIPGWHRYLSVENGFSFMLLSCHTRLSLDDPYKILIEQTFRQALKEYYEQN